MSQSQNKMYNGGGDARRMTEENTEAWRSSVRRDSARVIHSSAFRRLQGKTQLFPGSESDFFRNRLTHSLEVGQVGKSIAIRLNATVPELDECRIDPDLCELAGWCHDLGHPPFGHNGEEALHECMKSEGGWEGNAQTLRILTRLAKRSTPAEPTGISDSGYDERLGLNLTARTLLSVLKYDAVIDGGPFSKGYYAEESSIVDWMKSHALGSCERAHVKTVECQIMDIADDIAYSTYDLEDAFHAGFLSPAKLISTPMHVLDKVAGEAGCSTADVLAVVRDVFVTDFPFNPQQQSQFDHIRHVIAASDEVERNGAVRTALSSQLVSEFIAGVEFEWDDECPPLSEVTLSAAVRGKVEVLKHLTFQLLIASPRLQVARVRAKEIVTTLFSELQERPSLLPNDWYSVYERVGRESKSRVVADFVGCMTDRYAIEFYGRLRSQSPQTIFKPL